MILLRTLFSAAMMTMIVMTVSPGGAEAGEHKIVIHHMELQEIDGTLRVGDKVIFENQSDMAHNLYVTYDDGTMDNLDTQFPGMQRSVILRKAGPAVVRCWIHPIIKAEVEIMEATEPNAP